MTINEVIDKVNEEISNSQKYIGWRGIIFRCLNSKDCKNAKVKISEILTLACEMYDIFRFLSNESEENLKILALARDNLYKQRRKMW